MKTIFEKEWREHFKVAVVGLVIFSFLLAFDYWNCTRSFAQMTQGALSWQIDYVQPILSGLTLFETGAFCALFGALLGWLQIHSERHRDLWAFLVHRPISRAEIFFGKVAAGLCLYTAGAALPLVVFFIAVRMPGHFAAPFEWPMLLPIFALLLTGMIFYFAGLLTGVRQARWYGSRGLGLVGSILVMIAVINVPTFWQALVLIVAGGTIIALAAYGSFNTHGFYKDQPPLTRCALVFSLTLGCCAVVMLGIVMMMVAFEKRNWTSESIRYQMTLNGTIYKVVTHSNNRTEITDLKGVLLKNNKTGQPATLKDFHPAMELMVPINTDANPPLAIYYFHKYDYFNLWRQTSDTLWYWERNGRLWAYDISSRRFVGSLGPNGFAAGSSSGRGHFTQREGPPWLRSYNSSYPAGTLMTSEAVYKVDLENRACEVLFEDTNGEQIIGAADYSANGNDWDYTVVATKSSVYLLRPDGQSVWQAPIEPAYPAYHGIRVSFLGPTNQFALWIGPNSETNKNLPTHVVWLAGGQGALNSTNVPPDRSVWKRSFAEKLPDFVAPPVAFFIIQPFLQGNFHEYSKLPWADIKISLAASFVFAVVGLGLGRRYYFSVKDQVKWAVFHLLFSLPGLLAFICVQEWPARVACPNCKRLRLVDRENCEYCEANFAPPPKNGTEVFESISHT